MVKFLVNNRFTTALIIGLLFALMAFFMFTHTETADQRLGTYFLCSWKFWPGVVFPLEVICMLVTSILVARISNTYNLMKTYSFVAVVFYLLAMLLMRSDDVYLWVMIGQLLTVLLLLIIFLLKTDKDSYSKFFYGGVILSVLILIYPPSLVLIASFLLAANVNQSIRFRHIFFFTLGLMVPMVYLLSYLYLTDGLQSWYAGLTEFRIPDRNYGRSTLVILAFYLLFIMTYLRDINRFTTNYNWNNQQIRLVLLFMCIGVLLSTLFSFNFQKGILQLNAPMLGLTMTTYYVSDKPSRFALILLFIFVILSFGLYYIF